MRLELPGCYDGRRWYGRGPEESYCDRKGGIRLGLYERRVSEMEHRYMRPQENGNHCDVRFVEIREKQGSGIRIEDGNRDFIRKPRPDVPDADSKEAVWDGMNFSVHTYSQEALDKAEHIHELSDSGHNHLHVDAKVCGVGGDLPGIALLKEGYKIRKKEEQEQRFVLRRLS